MSKQENNEENQEVSEDTIKYVYLPDEGVYGTIISENLWYSIIEYYDLGIKYNIEVDNNDFIVLDEIGIGYLDEKDENL
jgi:hypothetical protein